MTYTGDFVMTKHVFVFMLIPLSNTNRTINHRRFRGYPEVGPVTEAPGVLFSGLDIVSVRAVQCNRTKSMQCRWLSGSSRDDLMFTWGTQLRPPRSSCTAYGWSSRSGHQDVDDIVFWEASEQLCEEVSHKPDCPHPMQDLQCAGFWRPTLARAMRAALAMKMLS